MLCQAAGVMLSTPTADTAPFVVVVSSRRTSEANAPSSMLGFSVMLSNEIPCRMIQPLIATVDLLNEAEVSVVEGRPERPVAVADPLG